MTANYKRLFQTKSFHVEASFKYENCDEDIKLGAGNHRGSVALRGPLGRHTEPDTDVNGFVGLDQQMHKQLVVERACTK